MAVLHRVNFGMVKVGSRLHDRGVVQYRNGAERARSWRLGRDRSGFHGATAWPAEREWEFRAASSAIVDFSSTESKDNNLHPIEHTLFNVMKDQAALRLSDKSCERAAGQRFEDRITLFAAALEAASDSEDQTQIPAPNLRSQRPRRAPPSFAMADSLRRS
jgi:hypothetical protein